VKDDDVAIRPLARLDSREMVTDAMLAAGEAVGRYCRERGIAIPYAVQPAPQEVLAPQSLAEMYAFRRQMQPSRMVTAPGLHAGLGLEVYTRATSPLRRYVDLLVHQQLRAHVSGAPLLSLDAMMERLGAAEAVTGSIARTERMSNEHWTLVFLRRHPDWSGTGVVVDLRDRQQGTLLIPSLGLETRLRLPMGVALDEEVTVRCTFVDLPDLTARFQLVR
jgi:exoribonuclease-2